MSFYTQTSENMDSPRSQSPKQGLDVVAMADSVLLIYLESARPKVKTTFTFCPMRHESKTKYCRLLKNLPNTEYVQWQPSRKVFINIDSQSFYNAHFPPKKLNNDYKNYCYLKGSLSPQIKRPIQSTYVLLTETSHCLWRVCHHPTHCVLITPDTQYLELEGERVKLNQFNNYLFARMAKTTLVRWEPR